VSFEFGMRPKGPQGFVSAPAEPEEYDVDEEEADPAAAVSDRADLQAALTATNVLEVLDELDRELIALTPVKTRIREIAALLLIDRLRAEVGLASERPSLHMSFTGNPGTGKTTVALKMAAVLHRLGYIDEPRVVSCTRDDLVGQYVGHTAPKTKEVLRRAYGGVLFIDEAYYLYKPENERDYGGEAIEILLQVMEAERDKLVVIFAGYKDRMDDFFKSNPGLSSRVAHHIDFPDYSVDELMEIAHLMLEHQNYVFGEGAEDAFQEYLERRVKRPRFAHGRSVRNSIDRARLRQANRLFAEGLDGELSREELMTITPDDILQSSVFAEDREPEDEAPAQGAV
jgi:probable Rubsico expression protein CbbX